MLGVKEAVMIEKPKATIPYLTLCVIGLILGVILIIGGYLLGMFCYSMTESSACLLQTTLIGVLISLPIFVLSGWLYKKAPDEDS
jgi:hypothetical protein